MSLGSRKLTAGVAGTFLLFASCQFQNDTRPSVLLIGVDNLPFGAIECDRSPSSDSDDTGIAVLCSEAIRFTHAYTPSVLSQPALTSLLTAQYPFEHGVSSNGGNFLSAKYNTVTEVAVQLGYRTLLVSGGPPVWRKSGLSQGFEVFDDHVDLTKELFFRPVRENFQALTDWLTNEVRRAPFFATIYVPDLRFIDISTSTENLEVRESSFKGQLQEFEESIGELIQNMKQIHRWDSTFVILAGLNGNSLRKTETATTAAPSNIYFDQSQITLLMKPARQPRDRGLQWKIDENVSLVDVGATLYDLFEKQRSREGGSSSGGKFTATGVISPPKFRSRSLLGVLTDTQATNLEKRHLVIESGWPLWKGLGPKKVGLVLDHYYFVWEENPKVFNALIDRTQVLPLSLEDMSHVADWSTVSSQLRDMGYLPWPLTEKSNNLHLQARSALKAIEEENWPLLKTIGEKTGVTNWIYLAKKNLNQRTDVGASDGCLNLAMRGNVDPSDLFKTCDHETAVKLISWIIAERKSVDVEFQRDRFLKTYTDFLQDRNIQNLNIRYGEVWDVSSDLLNGPKDVDLILNLPEHKNLKSTALRMIRRNKRLHGI